MASRPLIKDALFLLNICGIDPHKSNAWSYLRTVATLTILTTMWVDILLELIWNWKGLESMQVMTICVGFYQILSKCVMLGIYRKRLVNLMVKFEAFWPTKNCSLELENKIQSTHQFVRRVVKFMAAMLGLMVVTFTLVPFLGRVLPFKVYYPVDLGKSPDYELAFVFQVLLMLVACTALFGLDGLFVALIINITSELKMLGEGFGAITIDQSYRGESKQVLASVYRLMDHHALILQCIKEIRDIYSIFLLNVYFYSMTCMGVGLLSIVATGFPPSLDSMARFGMLVIFYALQLFCYCATGSYLTTESERISALVYETDWWVNTQPELRNAYVLVLMRANKAETLTAGGMFSLNLESFTKVIRSTLSLFTLVEALYQN